MSSKQQSRKRKATEEPPIPAEVQRHSHAPKDRYVRTLSVIACAKAWHDNVVDLDEAVEILKVIDKGHAWRAMSGHHRDKLAKIWDNFWKYGNVDPEKPTGRPVVCPDELTDLACQHMHEGMWRDELVIGDKTFSRVCFYDTVPQLIADNPDVAALLKKHDLTAKQLYAAMVRKDPDMIRHSLTFKPGFEDAELTDRKQQAGKLLEQMSDIWPASRMVLDRMVFLDEGGFALSSTKKSVHKVWAGKEDLRGYDVICAPHVPGQKDTKVHFLVAVCSHPAFDSWNGIVFYEKTTGTTDIRRSVNTLGQTAEGPYEYHTLEGTLAQSTVSAEIADLLYLIVKKFIRYTGEQPILVMDNVRIQARIPDDKIVSRYGTIDLPADCRIRIPPHSPDFNQPAEHMIAEIKKLMRRLLYHQCMKTKGVLQRGDLMTIFNNAMLKIKRKKVYKNGVLHNVMKMPTVWGIISTPKGEQYIEPAYRGQQNPPKKAVHEGSGGDWPHAGKR